MTTSSEISFYVGGGLKTAPELVAAGCLAEELGFDGFSLPDHVFLPDQELRGYLYSDDGHPPFEDQALWIDVWVAAAAVAAQTQRLRFSTSVYILPLRHPLLVARAVATLDALAPGRVEIGVGVGWLQGEFENLGVDFTRRGALTDEGIELLRKLWRGGLVEHDGPGYKLHPGYFEPHPQAPIQILVGGTSSRALDRAARLCDGYIPMPDSADQLLPLLGRLHDRLDAHGRRDAPFTIRVWSMPHTLDDHRRLIEAGVNSFMVSLPPDGDLAQTRAHLERFLDEIAEPLRASGHVAVR